MSQVVNEIHTACCRLREPNVEGPHSYMITLHNFTLNEAKRISI